MSWRPYDPQLPEFRYRPKGELFGELSYAVFANKHYIGDIYHVGPYQYVLRPGSRTTYNIDEVTDMLWDSFKEQGCYE